MAVQVVIPADVERLLGLGYTHVDVLHSRDGAIYESATASAGPVPAVLRSDLKYSFLAGGGTLKILDGSTEHVVEFPSVPDFWSPQMMAERINAVAPGMASYLANMLTLTGSVAGRLGRLEISYCDIAGLGLSTGQMAFGKAASIPLVAGTFFYFFDDVAGVSTDRYKTMFSANGDWPRSELSAPFSPNPAPVSNIPVSIGTLRFASIDGFPRQGKVIVSLDDQRVVGGYAIAEEARREFTADENGLVLVRLPRGARVTIAIEGTTYVRKLTVPDTATFDILQAMSEVPDPFTIQRPQPSLYRRNPL